VRFERVCSSVEIDACPACRNAHVLESEPELVGPEVRAGGARRLVPEDRAGDGGGLVDGARPVLEPEVTGERRMPGGGGVSAGVDIGQRRPPRLVGGDGRRQSEELSGGLGSGGDEEEVAGELGPVGEGDSPQRTSAVAA